MLFSAMVLKAFRSTLLLRRGSAAGLFGELSACLGRLFQRALHVVSTGVAELFPDGVVVPLGPCRSVFLLALLVVELPDP